MDFVTKLATGAAKEAMGIKGDGGPKSIVMEGQAAISKALEKEAKFQVDQVKSALGRELGVNIKHEEWELQNFLIFSSRMMN